MPERSNGIGLGPIGLVPTGVRTLLSAFIILKKMYSWIVLLILVLGLGSLSLLFNTVLGLIFNGILIVLAVVFIKKDINDRNLLMYYLYSTVIVVVVLVFPMFHSLFSILKIINLNEFTQSVLLIYLLANLFNYLHVNYLEKKEKSSEN
tara:strand:+ start:110 stop:556 length:447 start_codon:yes stop_codon:yes gene_type:complete